ncbi:MAG TPA: 1-(5-phosphoribosyl)-5-((5-phosphoribosylamino)methylideneamino)imidazole-4-carboxamide isomerase [Gammaproteobacteria bacterium]|jgi:DUF971 family protein|nr:DUF971 domain-containing protein [Pseudomonadota bacterium]HAY44726.1 1-(5-phosphoribosyl)-5-((5-phosphoribosylamino)methylideneamino)imidazole-4-carboxamide isomerase [Gammaproteobacteria bacterium]
MSLVPTDIKLNQKSRVLTIRFSETVAFDLPCEFLRVHSPSAEVKGHGKGQEVLQLRKEKVNITAIEPVGHYAIKLVFDDNHDSGLYSWDLLHDLGENRARLWAEYLNKLSESNVVRQSQASDVLLVSD